jgi:hypothetical protein
MRPPGDSRSLESSADSVKYQLFLLRRDGTIKHLMDTTKAGLAISARRYSKQLQRQVLAVVDYNDGSQPERFRYENGCLKDKVR